MAAKIFKIFWYLGVFFLVSLALFILAFQLDFVQQQLAKHLQQTAQQAGIELTWEEVRGFLPLQIRAKNVALQIKKQSMQADYLVLHLSPFSYFDSKNITLEFELQGIHYQHFNNIPLDLECQLQVNTQSESAELKARLAQIKIYPGSYLDILAILQQQQLHVHVEVNDYNGQALASFFPSNYNQGYHLSANFRGYLNDWLAFINAEKGEVHTLHGNIHYLGGLHNLPILESAQADLSGKVAIGSNGEISLPKISGEVAFPDTIQPLPIKYSSECYINLLTQEFEARIALSPFQLAFISEELNFPVKGTLSSHFQLFGKPNTFQVNAAFFTPHLALDALLLDQTKAAARLSVINGNIQGEYETSAQYHSEEASSKGLIAWHEGKLHFSTFEAKMPSTQISGQFSLHPEYLTINGELHGTVKKSSELFKALTIDVPFEANMNHFVAEFNSTAEQGPQQIKFCFTSHDISLQNAQIGELHLSGHIQDLWQDYEGILELEMEKVIKNHILIDHFSFASFLAKRYAMHPMHLEIGGFFEEKKFKLVGEGSWQTISESTIVAINQLEGLLGRHAFHLTEATDLLLSDELFILSPLEIAFDGGVLRARAEIAEESIDCRLDVENLPAIFANLFLDKPLMHSGNCRGWLSAHGSDSQPKIEGQLLIDQLRLNYDKLSKFGPLHAEARLLYTDSHLKMQGVLEGITEQPMRVKADLPAVIGFFPLSASLLEEEPLFVQFNGETEITAVPELFVFDSSTLSGNILADVMVRGTWKHPEYSGSLELQNASWESLDTGAMVHDINAYYETEGPYLIMRQFNATDGGRGRIQGNGRMLLDPEQQFPFDWNFTYHNATLIRYDYVTANFSGGLNYKGNFEEGLLAGNLTIEQADFIIPDEVPALLKTVPVKFINEKPDRITPVTILQNKKPYKLNLGINLKSSGNIFVEGRELTSEWEGNIRYEGPAKKPHITGYLRLLNGEYNFNGRPIEGYQGLITFNGDAASKNQLYVIGQMDLNEIMVETILKGSISQPLISFRSNPPMSQKEILSWILFGRGISDITPFQGAELSQTVISLNNAERKPDMLSRIRNSIGIDRVDISSSDTADSNEVSLRVGKYISKGIFISLNKSINAEANQIALEAKLTDRFRVSAEVGDNSTAKINLKWEKDY